MAVKTLFTPADFAAILSRYDLGGYFSNVLFQGDQLVALLDFDDAN
ncbi:MAG: hypothetical protein JXA37_12075 [Chloroflexia bacterium]|nr:hypothetical protein [Chloroflexia bacterium]